MRVLLSKLGRSLLLFPNTCSGFNHSDGSWLLVVFIRVRSRRHKSSYLKIIQLLGPNPNQLVSFNRKANSKASTNPSIAKATYHNLSNIRVLIPTCELPSHLTDPTHLSLHKI